MAEKSKVWRYTCPGSGELPRSITLPPNHPGHPGRGQCAHCATIYKLRYDGKVRVHR